MDGWNAWFFSDRQHLASVWPRCIYLPCFSCCYFRLNSASLVELWIGFLDFYSGSWDDRQLVVSIRQKEPLTKIVKMWNSQVQDYPVLTFMVFSVLSLRIPSRSPTTWALG